MAHRTLTIIREEHAALAAVLKSIVLLLQQHRRQRTLPDFRALRALIFYLDEFPEKKHHRKESQLLFPKLRARTPLSRDVLDRLDAEHDRGERLIGELGRDLLAFEMIGEPRREAFEQAAQRYYDFYMAHMRVEEEHILPLAERSLTEDDWRRLDEEFVQNRDPMTGHAPDVDYRAFFSHLVDIVPAPLGFGTAA